MGPVPNPDFPEDTAAAEVVAVDVAVAVGRVLVPAAVSVGKFSMGLNSIVAFIV